MDKLVKKYAQKAVDQALIETDALVMCGIDDDFVWNTEPQNKDVFTRVFDGLNINSLMYGRPKEPYASIIEYLAKTSGKAIFPKDSETRTFLHDLPIADAFDTSNLVYHLKRRRIVILPDGAVASFGTVSPEEAFVSFSSVCFACYVKFMSDCLTGIKAGKLSKDAASVLKLTMQYLKSPALTPPTVIKGPFDSEAAACMAICEAGRITVENGLVDSFFGNVSVKQNGVIYISQTGSSLEELEGCIDPCPIDGSSSAGVTASSELTAHMGIYQKTDANVILHGHPKFAVIMSLDCDEVDCKEEGKCHLTCEKKRHIDDIPIVPGEVGTGRFGLCNTVPAGMESSRGVIVYGHGLFVASKTDFQQSVNNLFEIERLCINKFKQFVS